MTQQCRLNHEHKHGENTTCYHTGGCRCAECREAARVRENRRERLKAYGRYRPRIPTRGAIRRIQGLHVLGWTKDHLAEASGIDRGMICKITRNKWLTPDTFDRIEHGYRVLLAKGRGPSERSAAYAARQGWVSPLAWDDIDADETPADVNPDKTIIDDVRVWNAVNGTPKRHRLTALERRECVRILHARRWTDNRIAHQLGCHEQTVFRIRGELGLAAFEYAEQIKHEAA